MLWIVCVSFVLFPGSIDGTVRCWDTRSRRHDPIQVLDEARDSISSLKVVQHELLTGSAHHSHVHTSHAYHQSIIAHHGWHMVNWGLISPFYCLDQWMAEWDAMTWEWVSCMWTSSAVINLSAILSKTDIINRRLLIYKIYCTVTINM